MFKKEFDTPRIIFLFLTVLTIDQALKIYIKLHFPLTLYGTDAIVDWGFFKLMFVENNGMAMGTKISDFLPFLSEHQGKFLLTFFRLIAIGALGYWLNQIVKTPSPKGLRLGLTLIFAGAVGNLIDSIFYGQLFSHSYKQIAEFLPAAGGYAPLFFGHVVDMFQFPLVRWVWPEWVPFVGGQPYLFFQYIFNVADASISIGVGILLWFNKPIFSKPA